MSHSVADEDQMGLDFVRFCPRPVKDDPLIRW
jgi:hypothetical protein